MKNLFEEMVADADEFKNITDEGGSTLTNLVQQTQRIDADITQAEEAVKSLKAEKRKLTEELIPMKMGEMGVEKFETANAVVSIKPVVHASIPKDKQEQAFAELRANGDGDLIKNEVRINFGMGQDNEAGAVMDNLRQQGLEPTQKTFVHPSSLKAYIKDKVQSGDPINLDNYGAYVAQTAFVKGK